MESIKEELAALDKEISAAEKDLARAEGQIESEKNRLLEFGVKYENAEEVLAKMKEQLEKIKAEATKAFEELRGKFTW